MDFRKTKFPQRRTEAASFPFMFLASAEPGKETLVASALLEDTAVLVVKGIKSFSISLHGSSEPQTDQTSNPGVEEKTLPLPSLHSSSVTGTDTGGWGWGGFQVSCQLALTTLSPPQEVFQYKWD